MKLHRSFFDPARLALAERLADERIAAGTLNANAREGYIRGFCRRASGDRPSNHAANAAQETTMNITAKTDLTTVSASDLLAFFNRHNAGKPVKRFATRAVAERRVRALLDQLDLKPQPAKKAAKKEHAPKPEPVGHAAAVSATWQDPSVAAARRKRHAVRAKGVTYRSVRAAFAELGLPDSKHQAFRKVLAAEGAGTFDGIAFKVVDAE